MSLVLVVAIYIVKNDRYTIVKLKLTYENNIHILLIVLFWCIFLSSFKV